MKRALTGSYPSSFSYVETSRKFAFYSTSYREVGSFNFWINVTFYEKDNQPYFIPLNYYLLVYSQPPFLQTSLKNQTVQANKKLKYWLPKCMNDVKETGIITVMKGTMDFISDDNGVITIAPDVDDLGEHTATIVCTDSSYSELATTYSWKVTVLAAVSTIVVKSNSTSNSSGSSNQTDPGSSQNDIDITQIIDIFSSNYKGKNGLKKKKAQIVKKQSLKSGQTPLTASMSSLSQNGEVVIKFNSEIKF